MSIFTNDQSEDGQPPTPDSSTLLTGTGRSSSDRSRSDGQNLRDRRSLTADVRGVSSLVGGLLLVAIVLVAVGGIAAVAEDTVSHRQAEFSAETAENDLETLSSVIAVATGGGGSQAEAGVSGEGPRLQNRYEVEKSGKVTIEVGSPSSGWATISQTQTKTITHESGEFVVGYQSGGVWRARKNDPSTAEVVQAPPISARTEGDTSLTLPIYKIRGNGTYTDQFEVDLASQQRVYEPLIIPSSAGVRITVESRFAPGWKDVFANTIPDANRDISLTEDDTTLTVMYGLGRSKTLYLHGNKHVVRIRDN